MYLVIYKNYFWYVEEENYGRNADLITKHFLAEGVVCDHSILIIDVERKPEIIVSGFLVFIHQNNHIIYDVHSGVVETYHLCIISSVCVQS